MVAAMPHRADVPAVVAPRENCDGEAMNAELCRLAEELEANLVTELPFKEASQPFVEQVPIAFARRHGVVVFVDTDGALSVALSGRQSLAVLDGLRRVMAQPMRWYVAPREVVQEWIGRVYQSHAVPAKRFVDALNGGEVSVGVSQEDLLDLTHGAPVVKLVKLLLFEAVRQEASDIHFQPEEQRLLVRFRIDGTLINAYELPRRMQEEVTSRIKVMAGMNVAETRLPQDGRTSVSVAGRTIDLRVGTIPSSFGERTVVRLLDHHAHRHRLEDLGMEAETLAAYRRMCMAEHGMILVTGPTGSGKTTTLYATLEELNDGHKNILTLEDPVEYQLPGMTQSQINEKRGLTFASGLRSLLRQDPDIIMVGEIRDRATAAMAVQSALTGHLVLSTLHTNNAAGAITRLLDLEVDAFLVAGSLMGVVAQRLARRLCDRCAVWSQVSPEERQALNLPNDGQTLPCRVAQGCDACRFTGYRGRIGLYELLVIDDATREQIHRARTASAWRQAAVRQGRMTLRQHALQHLRDGRTTVAEVLRVTAHAEDTRC